MNDPIVEEVRHHRMEHTRRFGGNLNLIFEEPRRTPRFQPESTAGQAHRDARFPASCTQT
jgi:hypothetical protein